MVIVSALIGCGYWGSKLREYIKGNENFVLKYVCNSKSDISKVFNDDEISAVFIATPNDTHFDICIDALIHGKNVLIEKPITLTYETANILRNRVRTNGRVLFTDYVFNHSRSLNLMKELISKGNFGKLMGLNMTNKSLGRFGGGDVYWILGSHMLSILSMFTDIDKLDYKVHDILSHDGIVETGSILFSGDISGSMNVSFNSYGRSTVVEALCEDGTLVYNPKAIDSLKCIRYRRPRWSLENMIEKEMQYNYDESNNLKYVVEEFYRCISEKKRDNCDMSVDVVRILEKLHEVK